MQGNDEPQRVFRSRALKRQIVEETLRAGASVSRVARKYGVNANQVFCWRRMYQQGGLELRPKDLAFNASSAGAHATDVPPALLPVRVVDALPLHPGALVNGHTASVSMQGPNVHAGEPTHVPVAGSIHVELGQARLRIDGAADAATLRMVIACLRGVES
jgi:transposase